MNDTTPWRRISEWWYSSTIPDLDTRWSWVVRFTPLLLYSLGTRPRYPLKTKLGGPQSRYTHCEEEKNLSYPCRKSNPDFPNRSPSLCRLSSVLIIVSQVIKAFPELEWTQGLTTAIISHNSSHTPTISGHMAPNKCISIHSNAAWPSFNNENRLFALSSVYRWPL
jgi:hypothetical protein